MPRETFSVIFYPRTDKVDKNKTVPIFMRITIGGERIEYSINERVKLNKWSKGKPLGNNKKSKELTQYIRFLTNLVLNKRKEILQQNRLLNTIYFKELLESQKEPKIKMKLNELINLKSKLERMKVSIPLLKARIKQLEIEIGSKINNVS